MFASLIARIRLGRKVVRPITSSSNPGRTRFLEKLWREFFADPSQWWDHRSEKQNPRYPDFKHKKTGSGLWLTHSSNPPWVKAELATLTPETLQLGIFSWNQKLSRYLKAGEFKKAIELFQEIKQMGMSPDKFTFVKVLKACSGLRALEQGRCIHLQIIQAGHESDVYVGSALIDMYAKSGSIEDACRVFRKMPIRDVVSSSTMILGWVRCGQAQKALNLFGQMHGEGLEPSPVTFVGVLKACASLQALETGRHLHEQITRGGYGSDIFVASSLLDMYAKCGSMADAWRVFNKMPKREVVAWTAMILGYVNCREGQKALRLFREMQLEGVEPDPKTFVVVLNACASLVALEEGRRVHHQIIQRGYDSDVFVGSSLLNFYSKCGSIEDAWRVFNEMPMHDIVSWTAMLEGFAMNGHVKEALAHFEQMCREDVQINSVTFTSLLSACNHAGLVDEGLVYFESMVSVYSISASLEQYACMVDLLGRAGRLHEAEVLIKMGNCEPNASMWMSLLAACTTHGNIDMGEQVGKLVLKLCPENSAARVLMSNMYAGTGLKRAPL